MNYVIHSRESAPGSAAAGDINIKGAALSSQDGQISLAARDNIDIGVLTTKIASTDEQYSKSNNLLGSRSSTKAASSALVRVEGSTLSGKSVALRAGDGQNGSDKTGDIRITASNVIADQNVQIAAARDLTIDSAAQTSQQQSSAEERTSGLFGNGGLSVTLGKRSSEQQQDGQASQQIGATVASLGSDVQLTAGARYSQSGSDVLAVKGDVDILGQRVDITVAESSSQQQQTEKRKQSGLTLTLSNPLVSAAQTIDQTSQAARNTNDPRLRQFDA